MSEEKEKDSNEEPQDPVEDEDEEDQDEEDQDEGDEGDEDDVGDEDWEGDGEEVDDDEGDEGDLVLEERVLCSDGACIGVVGQDGKCKVCGTPHPDGPPAAASPAPAPTEKAEQSPGGETVASEEQADDTAEEAGAGTDDPLDFSKRVLCSDGTCIGVIGKDGTCRTCGKPYTGEPEN
jgi:hypothetical protein